MSLRITPPELSYRESVLSPGKIYKREETISSPDGKTTEREEIRIQFNRNVKVVQNYRTVDMNGGSLSPSDWHNLFESVFKEHKGENEYTEKLEEQVTLFQKSCQEGSFVRNIGIYMTERRFKDDPGIKATRIQPGLTSKTAVGAFGHAVIEKNELIPENDFFVPGRTFEVRLVHSNYPNAEDDVETGIRTLAIKFSDHHSESPLDLVCYTGYLSPFFTAKSVENYLASLESEEAKKEYLYKLPIYLKTHIEGVRYKPDSYYHQHYYSQRIYDFYGTDKVRRLVRIRFIPADGGPETGRLTPDQQYEAWKTSRDSEDDTPKDYLKREYIDRMNGGPVDYLLQMQVNDTDFGHMMYNASLPWEELIHPWVTCARVSLTRQMPDDVMHITRFNMTNLPEETIRVHQAESSVDFNVVPKIMNNACVNVDQFSPVEPKFIEGDTTDYIIHVVTGNRPGAGTDANVFISIIGTEGSTTYRKLYNPYKNIFEKSDKDTFVVVDKPVGEFLCAKIYKDNKGSSADWFLEYIVLATPYNGRCYTLPCYAWFSGKKTCVTLKDGKGILLSQERNPYLRLQRKLEIQDHQHKYKWARERDNVLLSRLPGYIAADNDITKLPRDLQFDDIKTLENAWLNHVAKMKASK